MQEFDLMEWQADVKGGHMVSAAKSLKEKGILSSWSRAQVDWHWAQNWLQIQEVTGIELIVWSSRKSSIDATRSRR
jgi:hypothetical protein